MILTDKFDFLIITCPKRVFTVQNRKMEHDNQIQHIQINHDTNFHCKQPILIFCTKFDQKGYLQSKTEQMNITTKFSISELTKMSNFILNRHFLFIFGQIFPKRIEKITPVLQNFSLTMKFTY